MATSKNPVAARPSPLLYWGHMGKAAAPKTTTSAEDDIQQAMKALNAKQQFIGATMNLSWRLALTVLIPLVGGIKLDQHFDSSPSLTLAGFFLAVFGACLAVMGTVKEVNQLQAEEDKKSNRRKRV